MGRRPIQREQQKPLCSYCSFKDIFLPKTALRHKHAFINPEKENVKGAKNRVKKKGDFKEKYDLWPKCAQICAVEI